MTKSCLSHILQLFVSCFLLITSALSQDQRPSAPPSPTGSEPRVLVQPVAFFTPDTGQAVIHLQFRIPRAFFTFLRQAGEEFQARGEIVAELLSEREIIVGREFRPILVTQPQGAVPTDAADIQGVLNFKVPPGSYSISFEVKDLQSERRHFDRAIAVRIPALVQGIQASVPVLVEADLRQIGPDRSLLVPLNYGGALQFGTTAAAFAIQVVIPDSAASIDVRWRLTGRTVEPEFESPDYVGTAWTELRGMPELQASSLAHPTYAIATAKPAFRVLVIPIPSQKLEPGMYQWALDIRAGNDSTHVEAACPVVWSGKPMSLSRNDIAVEALRHIASEEEMEQIKSLSASKSLLAFRKFWLARNPDATKAFNPVMVEYYRRVDEAILRFSSTQETDGYKTDQGKIFILYGSPSVVDRKLHPSGGQTETWTYIRLKKRFVFELHDSAGIFVLTSMDQW